MQTIAECVNRLIARKPFVAEALQKGIINNSSLARNIIPEIEDLLKRKVQQGAVIMALQRYSEEKEVVISNKLRSCLNNISDVFVRSGLSEFTYKNSDNLFNQYVSFIKNISIGNDVFFTFVHGVFETNYVLSNSLIKKFLEIFKNETQVACETELSSITIRLPKINVQIQGLYYYILQGVAWEGINIINMISTSNEFTIIVKDADVERAFGVVKNLKDKKTVK
jgi:hypothetical protein